MDLSQIPNRFKLYFSITKFDLIKTFFFSSITIDKFLSMPGENIPSLEFEQVPFNHPLFIISFVCFSFY